MPAHPNPIGMLVVAEMRREELLKQADQYRLAEQPLARRDRDPGRRRSWPRATLAAALRALAPRVPARARPAVQLASSASGETT